jgi:hypothetical protein
MVTICTSTYEEKKESLSFSIRKKYICLSPSMKKHFLSYVPTCSAVAVYIKPKHTCTIIFIHRSLVKRRTATYKNAKNQPNALFVHPLGVGDNKLHGTIADNSKDGWI